MIPRVKNSWIEKLFVLWNTHMMRLAVTNSYIITLLFSDIDQSIHLIFPLSVNSLSPIQFQRAYRVKKDDTKTPQYLIRSKYRSYRNPPNLPSNFRKLELPLSYLEDVKNKKQKNRKKKTSSFLSVAGLYFPK